MVIGMLIGIGCGLLIYSVYILVVTLVRKHKEKKKATDEQNVNMV